MVTEKSKLGLGGSCHWCTEAIFLSLNGVTLVEQGWISSFKDEDWFSEAIIVHFNTDIINLEDLIEIHLHTHSCTSNHSMRHKYRSAVYGFSEEQTCQAEVVIKKLQKDFDKPIITKAHLFNKFNNSRDKIQNYYYKNPQKPFCVSMINPKLSKILEQFKDKVNIQKIPDEVIEK